MKSGEFNWNDVGVCTDPEVKIVKMPKGFVCEIRLASTNDKTWRHGENFIRPSGNGGQECASFLLSIHSAAHADGATALTAGLLAAALFFQHDKKAIKALEDHHAKIHGLNAELPKSAVGLASVEMADAMSATKPAPALPALQPGELLGLPINLIQPNPDQPRKHFDPVTEQELADSIKQHGLLQPIAVRELPAEEKQAGQPPYEIILGERRWRAHGRAGLAKIEAKVYKGVTRSHARVLALIENLHRDAMNVIEEAEGFAALIAEGYTQEQVAAAVGRSRPVVANALRVLDLPEKVVELIREKKLTLAHGVALARFKAWPKVVEKMAVRCIQDHWTATHIEKGVPAGYMLANEGLIARMEYGFKPSAEAKKTGAYFSADGEWFCFDLEHWKAEQDRATAARKAKEEADLAEASADAKKAAKAKKLKLSDLDRNTFTVLSDMGGIKGMVRLIPDDKRASAKDYSGKEVSICTDKKFVDKLKGAATRVMKADRGEKLPALVSQAREKIKMLKKVGPRELAWLLARLFVGCNSGWADGIDHSAAERQGGKLPKEVMESGADWTETESLTQLSNIDQVLAVRALLDQYLETTLDVIVEQGAEEPAAAFLRWVLEVDTLGLLEETDEGKKEILERVKNAPWYQRDTAGEDTPEPAKTVNTRTPKVGELIEWEGGGRTKKGIVITVAEYNKAAGFKWDNDGTSVPVRVIDPTSFDTPYNGIKIDGITGVSQPTKAAKKGGKAA